MRRLLPVLLLGLLVVTPACKKKSVRKPVPTVDPVVFLPVPLAQRLPKDVEACFCTVNFRAHREALLKTNFWRLAAAYLDDKAPTAGLGANFFTQFIKTLDVDDFSLSAGQGSGAALAVARQIHELYDESRYRVLLSRLLPGQAVAPLDLALLDELILNLERFEMPPLLLGMRGVGAHERLKMIADWLTTFPAYAKAPASTVTTTQGEQFVLKVLDGSMFLTRELRSMWLEALFQSMPGLDEVSKGKLRHSLDVMAGKTFVIAIGHGKDTAFVGIARRKEQIRLAEGVEDSVVSREELKFAQEHAARDLLGFASWQPEMATALHQPEPTRTLRHALLARQSSLAELVQAVGMAERALLTREFRSGAVAGWWEGGLQVEMRGGKAGKALAELQKPSLFHALADGEPVVFAWCGQAPGDGLARAYLESWARLAEAATLESEVQKPIAPFKPALMDAYAALKTMWEKGLGADGAFILDTGGRMPPLPSLPAGAEQMALPRIMSVHAVADRAAVGETWARLEKALGRAVSAIPGAQPFQLPPAESSRRKEMVSHFYRLGFGSDDLMPCATISDERLLWGTSQPQQRDLTMVKNASPQSGTRLRLNVGRLRDFLSAFAKARGAQNPGDVGLREAIRWLAPLGVLDWHERAVDGTAVTRFSLGMKDIPAYN